MPNCFICNTDCGGEPFDVLGNVTYVRCPRCGIYGIEDRALSRLPARIAQEQTAAVVLSHFLQQQVKEENTFILDYLVLDTVLENTSAPSIKEQVDNLIRIVGSEQSVPGAGLQFDIVNFPARIGAATGDTVLFLLQQLEQKGLIHAFANNERTRTVHLTLEGWEYFEELERGGVATKIAFMAMKFGDEALNQVYESCFKPAVAFTGFELRNLAEYPRAGMIDDLLRVEIRKARFLIADLTHENRGAYWEAGYAEGLGKPVLYTCERQKWETEKTHFDTNHMQTVIWEQTAPADAAERLKAAIRATLPTDAKQTDD